MLFLPLHSSPLFEGMKAGVWIRDQDRLSLSTQGLTEVFRLPGSHRKSERDAAQISSCVGLVLGKVQQRHTSVTHCNWPEYITCVLKGLHVA